MYEFKHTPSHGIITHPPRAPFNFLGLEKLSFIRFSECPKFLTLATHTNLADTTPLHCICAGTGRQIDLSVPKQHLVVKISKSGLRFVVVLVFDTQDRPRWLVVCETNRRGFLLLPYFLNIYGNQISQKRKVKSFFRAKILR